MKKLLVANLIATFFFCLSANAQSLVNVASDPAVTAVRQYADEYFRNNKYPDRNKHRNHDDGHDKCDKKKRKNRDKSCDCGQPGNHYGKHKHQRDRRGCEDERSSCCCSGHNRDCDRNDERRSDEHYGRSSRDRDDDTYRRSDQPVKRNTEVQVKSRRATPESKPSNSRVGSAKKKAPARPKMGN